mgnify:FL=1
MTASTFFIALIVLSVALIIVANVKGNDKRLFSGAAVLALVAVSAYLLSLPGNISGRVEEKQQEQTQAEPTLQPTESEQPSSTYENKYGYEMDASKMRPVTGMTASGRIVPCMAEVDDDGAIVAEGDLDCDWSRVIQMPADSDSKLILSMVKAQDLTYLPFNTAGIGQTPDVTDCLSTDKDIIQKVNSGKWADASRTVSCYDDEKIDSSRVADPTKLTRTDIDSILSGKGKTESEKDKAQGDKTDKPQSGDAAQSGDNPQSGNQDTKNQSGKTSKTDKAGNASKKEKQ